MTGPERGPTDVPATAGEAARAARALPPRWHRVALAVSLLFVGAGVALLPFVILSMVDEYFGDAAAILYDLMTGEEVVPGEDVDPGGVEYLNVAAVDLDAATGVLTLAVSGNRVCAETCPAIDLTFLSLDSDASRRRGVTPFATVRLGPDDAMYSESIALPIQGTPTRYPFDTYRLWLGLGQPPAAEFGETAPPPRPAGSPFAATIQNQLPQLVMASPEIIDAARVRTSGTIALQTVLSLDFRRPAYLSVLSVVLVLLVAASGALALLTQSLDTLVLGIGGLILGIWGVRSVLVPQPVAVVTAVDLALSGVILFLLLGLAARTALHMQRQSGVRVPWSGRRW